MPLGFSFPRPAWVRFCRLQTGVGLFRPKTHKWNIAPTAACECGTKEQTAEHVITSCPIYHHPNTFRALSNVAKKTCPVAKKKISIYFKSIEKGFTVKKST